MSRLLCCTPNRSLLISLLLSSTSPSLSSERSALINVQFPPKHSLFFSHRFTGRQGMEMCEKILFVVVCVLGVVAKACSGSNGTYWVYIICLHFF